MTNSSRLPVTAPDQGWRPGLVALDIDGTVVDHAGVLPVSVYAAVQRVRAAGVPVVLSTGRAWHGTRPVFEALDLPRGYAVSSNGAVVVEHDPDAGTPAEIVRQMTFDPGPVIERVAERAPHALIATEVVGEGYRVSGAFPEGDLQGQVWHSSLAELKAELVTRVIVRDPASSDAEFLALAESLGLHGVSYSIGYSAWLDIAPEGVHKATGLAHVCARLGVDRVDVLALGDGRNDIEMLRWAGRGVALGDAPAEVRAAADAVTDLFADDGTPHELARWFPA